MRAKAFFDGNCRLGDRGSGAAIVYGKDGEEIGRKATYLFGDHVTNNIAEWRGLINALELAKDLGSEEIKIFGDSELIIRQFLGRYQVRKEHLKPLHREAVQKARAFKRVSVHEIRRSGKDNRRRNGNSPADDFATTCMKAGRDLP
jgi:ribonuclease HI